MYRLNVGKGGPVLWTQGRGSDLTILPTPWTLLRRVRTNRTRSGWAVVKLWCVPVLKVKQRGFAMCSKRKVFAQVKLLLAQNKVGGRKGMRMEGSCARMSLG